MRGLRLATMRVLAACATILFFVACQTMSPEPNGQEQQVLGFVWLQAGQIANGCNYYIKKPTQSNILVDQALWFRRDDGSMTTNAGECVPH